MMYILLTNHGSYIFTEKVLTNEGAWSTPVQKLAHVVSMIKGYVFSATFYDFKNSYGDYLLFSYGASWKNKQHGMSQPSLKVWKFIINISCTIFIMKWLGQEQDALSFTSGCV